MESPAKNTESSEKKEDYIRSEDLSSEASFQDFFKPSNHSENLLPRGESTTSTTHSSPEEYIKQIFDQPPPDVDLLDDPELSLKENPEDQFIKLGIIESPPNIPFKPAKKAPQIFAAIAVSLCSLIIGFASAYTSPALPSMAHSDSTFQISANGDEVYWIGSLLPLGALVGGISGGFLIDFLGRKKTILATAIPFIIAWILIALAQNIWMVYSARTMTGFAIGIASLALPVYLAEALQPEVRGILGLLPTTIGNSGIVICYLSGMYLTWRELAFFGGALSVPFLIFSLFIPETPRHYISRGKEEKAYKSLKWLRGSKSDISPELRGIKNSHIQSWNNEVKLTDLLQKEYIKPILIGLGLMFFQQFSGINAIIFYTVEIFEKSGSSLDKNISTIIVGLVNFVATFIALLLIDRLGRKVLLIISDVLMIICLGVLSVFFYIQSVDEELTQGLGLVPLFGIIFFILAFGLGFGPVPWLLMSEIFPMRIRSKAASLTTTFNWACTFLVTRFFPEFSNTFGNFACFLLFEVVCVICLIFIIFCVPETSGLSLEDIEKQMAGKRFRKRSSIANLKPFPLTT